MTTVPNDLRIQVSAEDLCDALARLEDLQEELLELLVTQERALVEVKPERLDEIRELEEALLRKIIEEEKERLLITEEIGDLLDHDTPPQVRIAEILPHLNAELASSLSVQRDALRDVALRLARQNSVNRALIEHSVGHIQIFMSRLAAENCGENGYGRSGGSEEGDGGPFLMDRRA